MTDQLQVLDVALALHMSHMGGSDPFRPEDRDRYVAFLTERVEKRRPSIKLGKRFDDAVREVLKAALDEVRP